LHCPITGAGGVACAPQQVCEQAGAHEAAQGLGHPAEGIWTVIGDMLTTLNCCWGAAPQQLSVQLGPQLCWQDGAQEAVTGGGALQHDGEQMGAHEAGQFAPHVIGGGGGIAIAAAEAFWGALQQDGLHAGAQASGQFAPQTDFALPIAIGGIAGTGLQHAGLHAGAQLEEQPPPQAIGAAITGSGGGGGIQHDGVQDGAHDEGQLIPHDGGGGGGGIGGAQQDWEHDGAQDAGHPLPHSGGVIGASGMKGRFWVQHSGVQLGAHLCEQGDGQLSTGGGGIIGPTWAPVQQLGVQAGAHAASHDWPHGPGEAGICGGAGGSSRPCVNPGKQHWGVHAGAHAELQPSGHVCGGGIGGSIGGGDKAPQQLGAHAGAHDDEHGAGHPVNMGGGAIGAVVIAAQQSLLHDG